MKPQAHDFTIQRLGEAWLPSPLNVSYFTSDEKRILLNIYLKTHEDLQTPTGQPQSIEVAGPREKIFFDPAKSKAAIVTCGGLCPGINDVIRAIVTMSRATIRRCDACHCLRKCWLKWASRRSECASIGYRLPKVTVSSPWLTI